MPEPAFDTLEAARRLKSAGIEVEHAEAIVEVMGQSVNQLVTRDHFSTELGLTREHFNTELRLTREHFEAGIAKLGTELHARIDGVESKVNSLEATLHAEIATVRTEIMRAVLIVVGVLIPAIGLMLAFVQFYSARGGGA